MAAIVYEGAAGSGGNLFQGLSFFFLQRIPSRQEFINAVKSNGGHHTAFEKKADIVIADHARKKDCPAGSISWTFIDRSVKAGKLEDKENHRAGPATHTVREVGSRQPAKSGRTPFTLQDDRDLMLWVTKAERSGLSIKGNDIYMQLEQINPRHTFQSWRDRWIRQLAHRPRPELPEGVIFAQAGPVGSKYSNHVPPARPHRPLTPDVESESAPSVKQEPGTQPESSAPIARPKPPSRLLAPKEVKKKPQEKSVVLQAKPLVPLVRKSTGGLHFTEEEDDYMIANYEDMASADEQRGVEAWANFAVDFPNHSAQEWHIHFIQTIKPMMERRLLMAKEVASASEEVQLPANTADSSKSSKAQPRDEAHDVSDSGPVETQIVPKRFPDPSTKDEKMFIEDLTAMAEDNDLEVNFNPIICGRKIPLFRLWQVVNMDKFGGYEEVQGRNLWSQVARELNFTDFRHEDAPKAIKSTYEQILPDFEEVRVEFVAELQDQAMLESQLRQAAEHDSLEEGDEEEELVDEEIKVEKEEDEEDEYDFDLEAPASVPRHPSSSKRNLEMDRTASQNGSPILGSSVKRQRLDKGKGKEREIPSTPDDVINLTLKPQSGYNISPLKYTQTDLEEDVEDELFVRPAKKTRLQVRQQIREVMEPETQDFNFLAADHDEDSNHSLVSLPSRRKANDKIPAPPGGHHADSSTQSQTDSQKNQELQDFVEHHQAIGYELEVVLAAIESTSMMTGNAAVVMEELSQGRGIPDNIQGVWTKADDAALEDVESEDFERIIKKHGTKSVVHRQKFLLLQSLEQEQGRSA